MTSTQYVVFDAILAERKRQDDKWGAHRRLPLSTWHLILSEEVGEVAEAVLDRNANLRAELVQVAAVAVAWLEALEET